jgi:hypothetical protein
MDIGTPLLSNGICLTWMHPDGVSSIGRGDDENGKNESKQKFLVQMGKMHMMNSFDYILLTLFSLPSQKPSE